MSEPRGCSKSAARRSRRRTSIRSTSRARAWTEAKDHQAGDVLVAEGGDRLSVDRVERIEGSAQVYNFEVRDLVW